MARESLQITDLLLSQHGYQPFNIFMSEYFSMAMVDGLAIGIPIFFAGILIIVHSGKTFRAILKSNTAALGAWISFSGVVFMLPFLCFLHSYSLSSMVILLLPVFLLLSGQNMIRINNRKMHRF
jgi:hypothetical protein